MVCATASSLNLGKQVIDPDLAGAHSLRAGRAMALKLHGYDDTTIMKMVRWTSLTFLQYIHNQIDHLSVDISKKWALNSCLSTWQPSDHGVSMGHAAHVMLVRPTVSYIHGTNAIPTCMPQRWAVSEPFLCCGTPQTWLN